MILNSIIIYIIIYLYLSPYTHTYIYKLYYYIIYILCILYYIILYIIYIRLSCVLLMCRCAGIELPDAFLLGCIYEEVSAASESRVSVSSANP